MKNIMTAAVIALTIINFATFGFAEQRTKFLGKTQVIVTGTIESINEGKNSFVIKDKDVSQRKTVYSDPSTIKTLSVGQTVKVVFEGGSVLSIK